MTVQKAAIPRSDWRRFAFPLILLALCGALYFWRLGLVPLEDFDEAYYAEGAREMLARGDFGTPYFNGQPFLLKPALIYWLIAAAFRLLGPTEFAARVASAFLATGIVLITYWFGATVLGRRAGFLAGLALAACYMWLDIGRDASIDIPLTAAVAPAMFLFYLGTQAPPEKKRRFYLASYPLFGLALLAKGPVPLGVVLCGLLAYLLAARRLRATLAEARVLPGVALFLAVAAPWYFYEFIREPAFFSTFIIGEHFGHIRGQLARNEPVWGNLFYLLIYFYPWVAFVPAAFVKAFRQPNREHVVRFAAFWALAVVVIFSIPKSKLAHYLAPAFPPLAIVVGAWLDDWLARREVSRWLTAFALALIAAAGMACAAAAVIAVASPATVEERLAPQFGDWRPGLAPVVMIAGLAIGALVAAGGARRSRAVVVPALALGFVVAGFGWTGWFNPRRAEIQAQPRKELALALRAEGPKIPLGVYYAKRNSTIFYLGRPIVDLGERPDEFPGVVRFLSSPAPRAVLTHREFVPELQRAVDPIYVADQRGDYVVVANRPLRLR